MDPVTRLVDRATDDVEEEGSRNRLKKKARTRRGGARREAPIRHADVGVVVFVGGVGGVFDRDDARDP